jgi:hypothetical protein
MSKRIRSFTAEEKCAAVEWHRQHGSVVSETAKEFGVDRKCIRDWDSKYDELKKLDATSRGRKVRKLHDGREPASAQLDDSVYEFPLLERRRFGLAVSNAALIDEARRVAGESSPTSFQS